MEFMKKYCSHVFQDSGKIAADNVIATINSGFHDFFLLTTALETHESLGSGTFNQIIFAYLALVVGKIT
jgi:hypothetical protein